MLPFLRTAATRLARPTPLPTTRIVPTPFFKPRIPLPPRLAPPTHRAFHTTPPNPSYYSRYQRSQRLRASAYNIFSRWAARPSFYYEVASLGALGGSFYLYHLEEVPISGRRRFNVISPNFEKQLGDSQYQLIQEQYRNQILPDRDPRVKQVKRVLQRLIPHSGLPDDYEWKVTVIESPETNAFVIPGGKVFVFTGILPICGDDDGLAAVLGHEIGHNVARHIAEQMSRGIFLLAVASIVEVFWGIPGGFSQQLLQLAIDRPRSRAQETEADHIGLMMMAKSCYDPKAAVELWERMQIVEKKNPAPPEILSTHPSSHRRQLELQELLPTAYQLALDSDCNESGQYLDQFRKFRDDFLF
ncbi:hypothetical protein ABW19_dt0200024 [Dactylella cylindrospora]|nr:hypothetical protein ABW19_dt0200024 [Dactylella cylindrospora]